MSNIGRKEFQEYDQFVDRVNRFKKALLDYVLDSLHYLQVLQDNFSKEKYQEETDLAKVMFIKSSLDKIDRTALKAFVIECIDLIGLTEKLRDKYGGKKFLLEQIIHNLLGITVVGLVLPSSIPMIVVAGSFVGFVIGSISIVYTLYKNWGALKDDIQIVRENLTKIKENLEQIRNHLEYMDEQLGKAKIESDLQYQQHNLSAGQQKLTYQEIADLEQYVTTTYEAFLQLKTIVLHPSTKNDL